MIALDHLTVADTLPSQLVEIAAEAGAGAVCLFLESMAILPRMPTYSLVTDRRALRETRAALLACGVGVDLVYPFTLAGRTEVAALRPAMEAAAELGARAVNVLVYQRDPSRRRESFAALCELAAEHRLGVALEPYPPSQVQDLEAALDLVASVARPDEVGLNVDFLHIARLDGALSALRDAPATAIHYGQYSDARVDCPLEAREFEASHQRFYPGEGELDVIGFARTLPFGVPISVEAPRDDLIAASVTPLVRARSALAATADVVNAARQDDGEVHSVGGR